MILLYKYFKLKCGDKFIHNNDFIDESGHCTKDEKLLKFYQCFDEEAKLIIWLKLSSI